MALLVILVSWSLTTGCSARRVHGDEEPVAEDKDQKIETMISALSRAQSRIEELDAKVASLTDKLESTRITVDNIAGNKPVKTEAVGSATAADIEPKQAAQNDSKIVLQMDAAVTDFSKAMKLFKGGKYTDAELAFNHFTETYPEHVLAGSAQFYAGESYFMMGEYKLALNEYGKVISSFATSPRVASAMVRLSHCYEASGDATEASRTMTLARELYSGNPSLDWPAPLTQAAAQKVNKLKADLNATPIEPGAKEDHE